MMIYAMRRVGVPLPVAATDTLMSFIATVIFFALAGPTAIIFGAGKSLGQHGNVLGLTLYDLFLGSLGVFVGIGVILVGVLLFPRIVRAGIQGPAGGMRTGSGRGARRREGRAGAREPCGRRRARALASDARAGAAALGGVGVPALGTIQLVGAETGAAF